MPTNIEISWFLIGAGALHAVFMLCELFLCPLPVLLRLVAEKLPEEEKFKPAQ